MNKSESVKELAAALVGMQAEIENVSKDGTNPHFRSRYATLPNVIDSIRTSLAKHGLAVIQTAGMNPEGHPTLETTLIHRSGEWISGTMPVLSAKGDMQGLGSAWTYARRYGLMAIVGVAADDDDAEAAVGRTESRAPGRAPVRAPEPVALARVPERAPEGPPPEPYAPEFFRDTPPAQAEAMRPSAPPIRNVTQVQGPQPRNQGRRVGT